MPFTRLLVHVEGQTEETVVNQVVAPQLKMMGYERVGARLLGNARLRSRRGGIRTWDVARNEIVRHLKEDTGCIASTMVDYYRLPAAGSGAWPARAAANQLPFAERAHVVQEAMLADVTKQMGRGFDGTRFVPFVMMHEFEGLLFSDCVRFAEGIGRPDLAGAFETIRNRFSTPEEINDSPATAPSVRIAGLFPRYQKPLYGKLAMVAVGLDAVRRECGNFRRWMETLEAAALRR